MKHIARSRRELSRNAVALFASVAHDGWLKPLWQDTRRRPRSFTSETASSGRDRKRPKPV
jgi:hypothetical protein